MQSLGSHQEVRVSKLPIKDGKTAFDATVLEAEISSRIVLFAVGAGGNPERHLPLLVALANQGCTVVAPHFERLVSPMPTEGDLQLRALRLKLALDSVWRAGQPVAGVGHSIGATMLLALAGGEMWMRSGGKLAVDLDARLEKLALLTPAMGFFRAPGALDAVHTPIKAWAGGEDEITPAPQIESVLRMLVDRGLAELDVVEHAGHFSFMNRPPPQATEPLPDREAFLAQLTEEVGRFITSTAAEVLAETRRLGLATPGEAVSIVRADRDRR